MSRSRRHSKAGYGRHRSAKVWKQHENRRERHVARYYLGMEDTWWRVETAHVSDAWVQVIDELEKRNWFRTYPEYQRQTENNAWLQKWLRRQFGEKYEEREAHHAMGK